MQKLTEFFESEDLDWAISVGYAQTGLQPCWVLSQVLLQELYKKHQMKPSSLHDPQESSCINNATLRITRHFEYNYKDS